LGGPTKDWIDATFTTLPFVALICSTKAVVTLKVPSRFTSSVARHLSRASASDRPPRSRMPALLTRIDVLPCQASTSAASRSQAVASRTSRVTACAVPPAFWIAAALCCAKAASTSVTTTMAPAFASPSAIAAPLPRPAPVTTATRLLRR